MCCTRLAEIQDAKSSPSAHHRTNLSGYVVPTKACISTIEKIVKQQYILDMVPQYGKPRPISGWDRFTTLGHPRRHQWVSGLGLASLYCTDVTQWSSTKLCTISGRLHFRGLLAPNGILLGVEFTLRPCLAFSYIASVTARHYRVVCVSQTSRRWAENATYRAYSAGRTVITLALVHILHCVPKKVDHQTHSGYFVKS